MIDDLGVIRCDCGTTSIIERMHFICCKKLQCNLIATCIHCKKQVKGANWKISEEELSQHNHALKKIQDDSYKKNIKRKRWDDGTLKMTRYMEKFEIWLFRRFGRRIGWAWSRFRYKFMR